MLFSERTRPGLGIIEPCLPSPAECDANRQQIAYVYFENEPGRRIGGQVAHEG
jgi:hypothetical protein